MDRKPQTLGQVVLKDDTERKELQDFCRTHFGRSFSAQCRYMLLKAKRELTEKERAAA